MTGKALVLDANILIRAVLGSKAMRIIAEHADRVAMFTPEVCFADARKHLPTILSRRGVPVEPALSALQSIEGFVQAIGYEWIEGWESLARARLAGRDEEDWPILATALTLDCPIWTEDADFFGVGVATWTTATIGYYFES
ncbi:hypothetical protein JKG47_18055 [Acidithiobacillus sp. MC6.1]|nr:hypothetical protein [Acidithiobacillus sp. MC6.1]